MSVISSRKSTTPSSILKRTSLRARLNQVNTPNKVRFVLPHSKKVQTILRDYMNKVSQKEYENLVCLIRDAELFEDDMTSLLKEATDCISLLNRDLWLFVEALLCTQWLNKSDKVIKKYQSFIVNLISAHNYHAKFVIDHLVSMFVPVLTDPEWDNGVPNDQDCKKCTNVHFILRKLLKVVPLCKDLLMKSLITRYPYMKKSTHTHEYYLHNLFWIIDYVPGVKLDIFHLIFSNLVIIDGHISKETSEEEDDVFPMDDDSKSVKTVANQNVDDLKHTLDVCLDKIFNYFITECHDLETEQLNWMNTKNLYQEMLLIFDGDIFPTYNIHHVQFVMFFLCSFKTTITEAFLNHLWKKVCNPNIPAVYRQNAVNYVVSLVARATFVPLSMVKGTLQQMAEWIHTYIATQDGLECVNSDVKVHSVFYMVCQALFYVISFRYKDLVTSKKNISFLESLNMAKIVTSRLNPLKVCQPAVAQNFAAITRKYQLAYCYSIMEHNSRNNLPTLYQDDRGYTLMTSHVLDTYYPFDPYFLNRSGEKVLPYYRNYQENSQTEGMEMGEADDFLEQSQSSSPPPKSMQKFSYGSSPGFKFK